MTAQEQLDALQPLLDEVIDRAVSQWAEQGYEFTVTVDPEMWAAIRGALGYTDE